MDTLDARSLLIKKNLCFMDTLALEGSNAQTVFLTVLKEIYRIISKKSLAIKDIDYKGVSLKATKLIIPGQE